MAATAYSYTNKKKGQVYFLHGKDVKLKNGRVQRIYYFAKQVNPETALAELPDTHMVVETERTGLPLLKKKVK